METERGGGWDEVEEQFGGDRGALKGSRKGCGKGVVFKDSWMRSRRNSKYRKAWSG